LINADDSLIDAESISAFFALLVGSIETGIFSSKHGSAFTLLLLHRPCIVVPYCNYRHAGGEDIHASGP
jgi:hypothetical protein